MISTLGPYQIITVLRQSEGTTVYRADDARRRAVVVKLLTIPGWREDPVVRKAFQRIARQLVALRHPAILPLEDWGVYDEQPYLVTPFVPGGTLADRLARGPLSILQVEPLVASIAPAIDAAHAQDIAHGHLSPHNIFFTADQQPLLADFGLAQLRDLISPTPTPATPTSDLAALRALLIALLVNPAPLAGYEHDGTLSPSVAALLAPAYPSASALAQALSRFVHGSAVSASIAGAPVPPVPVSLQVDSAPQPAPGRPAALRASRAARRRPASSWSVGAVLAVLSCFALFQLISLSNLVRFGGSAISFSVSTQSQAAPWGPPTFQPQELMAPENLSRLTRVFAARWGALAPHSALAWSPTNSHMVAGKHIFQATQLTVVDDLPIPPSAPLLDVGFVAQNSIAALVGDEQQDQIAFWSLQGDAPLWSLQLTPPQRDESNPSTRYTTLTTSNDGALVAAATNGRRVDLVSVTQRRILRRFMLSGAATTLAFSPDGKILVANAENLVQLWQVDDGALLTTLEGHRDRITDLAFSPDGEVLVTVGQDGAVILRSVAGCARRESTCGAILYRLNAPWHATSVAISPTGTLLAIAGYEPTANRAATPTPVVQLRSLVTCGTANNDTCGLLLLPPFPANGAVIEGLGFSPDGRVLGAVSREDVVFWAIGP